MHGFDHPIIDAAFWIIENFVWLAPGAIGLLALTVWLWSKRKSGE